MWLLDVNLPNGLVTFLRGQGVECDTAVRRGWRELTNGSLATAASRAGFDTLLTRDRFFGSAAETVLRSLPDLAVVVVTVPQSREVLYLAELERHWKRSPIRPIAGRIVTWP